MHGDLCNGEKMKDRPAKVENISFTSMANGRIQVYFLDPLRENDYEFHLFLKFFKKKQKHVQSILHTETKDKYRRTRL